MLYNVCLRFHTMVYLAIFIIVVFQIFTSSFEHELDYFCKVDSVVSPCVCMCVCARVHVCKCKLSCVLPEVSAGCCPLRLSLCIIS